MVVPLGMDGQVHLNQNDIQLMIWKRREWI